MKLLLAATIPGWHSLDGSRQTQHFRNELVKALRLVCDSIANNGSTGSKIEWPTVTVHWELELEPVATPADNEAA